MTPSPTPSLDGEAGEASLTDLVHKLHYAAYSWGFEAGKFGQHVDTTTAGNKANAALNSLLSALAAAIPALPPDTGKQAVQFQRRRGIGDGSGGFKWCEWQVCTEQDARRIASLRSWQWRKVVMPATSQPAPTPDAAWRTVARDGMPPCDGETVFVGINSAGFACCFNDTRPDGLCLMGSPECSTAQMSELHWWRVLDRPDAASMQDTSSPQSPEQQR